jgi:energy-coupling factor transporter ATP-binding protein EcfA2
LHIQWVKIRNVRSFREVDLDLTRPGGDSSGWTVLAGRNGSGKSTLLRALALAVSGPETAHALYGSFAHWIHRGQSAAEATALVEPASDEGSVVSPDVPKNSRFGGKARVRASLNWELTSEEPRLSSPTSVEGNIAEPLSLWRGEKGWFLAGYGPYRRLSGHATDAQRLMTGPDRIARVVSLFREDSSLIECVQWLREIYLRRLEAKPGAAELERAVLSLLNDGLLPDGVTVQKVDSDGLWVAQHGARLPLNELSDGYRTTAALVMDIVRHLHRAFDRLDIEPAEDAEGTFQRVSHSGVVLIDEVELHLHVSWQKRIGFWLKRHFPNIQFIVTTHSPFVCQAADPRGLIRLPAPGEDRPVEHVSEELYYTVVNGSADDAVMTELFGLETPYSEQSEKLRDEVAHLEARLQTGKATEKEEKELEELRSQIPQTPTGSIEQLLRKLTVDA